MSNIKPFSFAVQHNPFTRVGVVHEGKSMVLSLYRTGEGGKPVGKPQRWRFYNPIDVTNWFAQWSSDNLDEWRKAYHQSQLGARDFERPGSGAEGAHDVEAIVAPRLVPYHSQRDNERHPGGTCNVTSYAMVLDFYDLPPLLQEREQIEDSLSLWMERHRPKLDRHSHDHLETMGRAHGLDVTFHTGLSLGELRGHLQAGRLCIVSGAFTSSGHIVLLYGTRGSGFLCHDPWGDYNTRYKDHNGKARLYSEATLQRVLVDKRRGKHPIWAHVVRGKREGRD